MAPTRPLTPIELAVLSYENERLCRELRGDFRVIDWIEAPDWIRLLQQYKVEAYLSCWYSGRFSGKNAHESWSAKMNSLGWGYGKEADVVKATHPDLLTWSELPDDARDYWEAGKWMYFHHRDTLVDVTKSSQSW